MNADKIRAELIAKAQSTIDEYQKALDSLRSVLLGQGFVVVSVAGLVINYEVDEKTSQVKNPKAGGSVHHAIRFTKQDAENVAAATIDGNGNPARAVHITTAIREAIDDQERLIATIRATGPVEGE